MSLSDPESGLINTLYQQRRLFSVTSKNAWKQRWAKWQQMSSLCYDAHGASSRWVSAASGECLQRYCTVCSEQCSLPTRQTAEVAASRTPTNQRFHRRPRWKDPRGPPAEAHFSFERFKHFKKNSTPILSIRKQKNMKTSFLLDFTMPRQIQTTVTISKHLN